MPRRPHPLQIQPYEITPAGVKEGVWVDVGEFAPAKAGGYKIVAPSPPCLMRRSEPIDPGYAVDKGWIKPPRRPRRQTRTRGA